MPLDERKELQPQCWRLEVHVDSAMFENLFFWSFFFPLDLPNKRPKNNEVV